jgi:hypothetical protein
MEKCMLITPNPVFEAAAALAPIGTPSIDFADMLAVKPDLTNVDLVIAPLIGVEFDAIELIERLGRAKFKGRVQFMSKKLPNRQMVLRELRAVAERRGIVVDLHEGN